MSSVHDFTAQTIHGQAADLADYAGKTLLVVNVASECGLTPQYADLEALHRQYADQGLAVLGFPCNQFKGQEPGSEEQILDFCQTRYDVSFPLFSKIEVNGPNRHPLYAYLAGEGCGFPRRHLLELREIPHRQGRPTAGPLRAPNHPQRSDSGRRHRRGPRVTQPNIVFILIDDMGWKDLVCYGSSFYETPNIDRLAREGMRFTDAYAACPVCSPTRASILTGKYPATVGITDWIDVHGHVHPARGQLVDVPYLKQLPTQEHSLARALKEGGYQTWHVGKWHLGGDGHLPEDHGFEVNIGGAHQGSPGQGRVLQPLDHPSARRRRCPRGHVPNRLPDRPSARLDKQPGRAALLLESLVLHRPHADPS